MSVFVDAKILQGDLMHVDFRKLEKIFVILKGADGEYDLQRLRSYWYEAKSVYNRFVIDVFDTFTQDFWIRVLDEQTRAFHFEDREGSSIIVEMTKGKWEITYIIDGEVGLSVSSVNGLDNAILSAVDKYYELEQKAIQALREDAKKNTLVVFDE